MKKHELPVGLPDSLLIRELIKKTALVRTAPVRTPAYMEWLKAIRDRIAPELSYTIITFPLFTAHDEQNHIHPLFFLAERLLSAELLELLNATEVFLLACSLYAHDWGMAVSEQEKKCILGLAEPKDADSFRLLAGEKNSFAKRLRDHRIHEVPSNVDDVPLKIWQEHIRETHAARSAQRVRAYFSPIDENLGEAVALVSEGHCLDVERIRTFETALPLQGERANVRALGLYLRIIDLFDLAQDRTPFALWKFVSPNDAKSAEEWKKHRALSPIVIEPFQKTSRCIIVRGSTDDHRVYAALEDLKEYCENQLRLSNGLLNELEAYYQPRLLHLDWKVDPKGFEPISVRFEFDRQSMINVLSDEIYQGDRYVFLRELLQNSIDAIRLRQALHRSKDTGLSFEGTIQVKVEHKPEGCAEVSWTDNGTGMSAFIVRNYLTVAGRSFYRSEDFQKLGVLLDPISRFGVGILSCFMVADRLEILTRQDPQIENSAESLKIEIHSAKRHLRIQRCPLDELPPVGTSIKVFIENATTDEKMKSLAPKLYVTEYLKEIAGFVEFPIYVQEDSRRTLILHPDFKGSKRNLEEWEIAALDSSFPWRDFFLPQDVAQARDFFSEEKIVIKRSPKSSLFEGIITIPVLNEDVELKQDYEGDRYDTSAYKVIRGAVELGKVRLHRRWQNEESLPRLGRSSACNNLCRVYCDGILVPGVSTPQWIDTWGNPSTIRIVVNILRTTAIKLDLSRYDIMLGEQDWSEFVHQRCVDSFRNKAKKIASGKSVKESFYSLVRLFSYGAGFRKSPSELIGDIPIPLIVLKDTGEVAVLESRSLQADFVHVVPRPLAKSLSETIFNGWASEKWLEGKKKPISWSGGLCIFADGMTYNWSHRAVESFSTAERLQEGWLSASYDLHKIRFLSPGKKEQIPLIQEVWFSNKSQKKKEYNQALRALQKANESLRSLRPDLAYHGPKFVEFAAPFDEFFTAGWQYLNIRHNATKYLAECINAIEAQHASVPFDDYYFGQILDALYPLFGERCRGFGRDYLSAVNIQDKFEDMVRFFNLASDLKIYELTGDLSLVSETVNVPPVVKFGKLGAPIISLSDIGL